MRYLGIDYGTKKVGLALSDEGGSMGFPHEAVANDAHLLEYLVELVRTRSVGKVIIGESLDSGGQENPVAKDARALGDKLAALGIPVAYEMEAFTTQEARRDFEGNRTKGTGFDASAAALILTSYLSRDHGNDR